MAITDDMQGLAARLVEPLRGWFLGYGAGYTSGTWTPTFRGTGTAGTFTYVVQDGEWVCFGDRCLVSSYVQISAITVAPTGNMEIDGLPFTAASVVDTSPVDVSTILLAYPAGALQLWGDITANSSRIRLGASNSGGVTLYPAASFTLAPAHVAVAGWYRIV